MCYYVLKQNGNVLTRSTVRPLLKDEWLNEQEKQLRHDFDQSIATLYSAFDETLIHEPSNNKMVEPIFPDDSDLDTPYCLTR